MSSLQSRTHGPEMRWLNSARTRRSKPSGEVETTSASSANRRAGGAGAGAWRGAEDSSAAAAAAAAAAASAGDELSFCSCFFFVSFLATNLLQ